MIRHQDGTSIDVQEMSSTITTSKRRLKAEIVEELLGNGVQIVGKLVE